MNNNPLVSILINNYNYGRFLAEAIDSALSQTYSNIEVIVVDDGSTDNSREIIKNYGDKIIPILKPNGGQASAFNAGFVASHGEIICFLDSDDIFKPNKLEEIANVFVANQGIGWCLHPLDFLNERCEKIIKDNYTGLSGKYDISSDVQRGKKIKGKLPMSVTATSGLCFHRSLLERILPMPEEVKITSDDYIKYTALGISSGFILLKELSCQRIHANNAYTFGKKYRLAAKIQILTAYLIKKNFPILSKFTNNLIAFGISMYWRHGGIEKEDQKLVKSYLSSTRYSEIFGIYAKAFYFRLKQ